jgi:hypothetical protein
VRLIDPFAPPEQETLTADVLADKLQDGRLILTIGVKLNPEISELSGLYVPSFIFA